MKRSPFRYNVGALSEWFSRKLTGDSMTRWRKRVRSFLSTFNGPGTEAIRLFEYMIDATKSVLATPGLLFEGLGFEYVGPIDGHDVKLVAETLRNARQIDKPVLVHAVTAKGKGCPGVDGDVERKHGVKPFCMRTGKNLSGGSKAPTPPAYTKVFGDTICDLAKKDPRVVAITAAMPQGTGLVDFSKKYPGRFYDVGIAEQHAVTFAAGLAVEGFRPVAAIYSSFLQRAYDQVVHDVCLQKLPVIFAMDRGGLVGADGPTHHGVFDLSYLRMIPNMALMAPKDENELRHMLLTAVKAGQPVGLRYPRGNGVGVSLEGEPEVLPWGKSEIVQEEGHDLLMIAVGPHVYSALDAAKQLAKDGIKSTVINARFIKPLDEELLLDHIGRAKAVVTVEENILQGGFGCGIMELCEAHRLRPNIKRIGIPDNFIDHGEVSNLHKACGLSADGIVAAYRSIRPEAAVISIAQ